MRVAAKSLVPGLAGAAVFSLFINVLMLTVPIYSLQVYDRVLNSRSVMTLIVLSAVVIGLLLAGGLLDAMRNRLLTRVGTTFDEQVGPRAFIAALRSGQAGQGKALRRAMGDVETVRGLLGSPSLGTIFDLPWTPLYVGLLFLFHPLLGAIGLGGAIILVAIGVLSELIARKPTAHAGSLGREAGAIVELADRNVEVVQAMGLHRNLLRLRLTPHLAALREMISAGDARGAMTAISKTFRQILQVAMLGIGAWLAIQDMISPGVLIAGSIIMGRALVPIEGTIGSWRSITMARASYRRLERLLATTPDDALAMSLPRPEGFLQAEGVLVRVPNRTAPVLHGISFDLAPGESLGVIGPTASGKTTLARLLVGLLPATAGHIRLDGTDVSRWSRGELGPYLGYLPENPHLFPGTVAQNIARYGEVDPALVVEAARCANVHEMIQALPDGYDTVLEEDEYGLSSGQQQRIALARALYGNPVLVVLDEPDSNVDHEGDRALIQAIRRRKDAGGTTVVISHRLSILSCVDKVLLLNAGRAEAFGLRDELVARLTASRQLPATKQVDAA